MGAVGDAARARAHRRAGPGLRLPDPRPRRVLREHGRPHHLAAARRRAHAREPVGPVVGGGLGLRPLHGRRRRQRDRRPVGRHPGHPHPHRAAPPPPRRPGRDPQPPVLGVGAGRRRDAARDRPPERLDVLRRPRLRERVHRRGRLGRARRRPGHDDRRRQGRVPRQPRHHRHRGRHQGGHLPGGHRRAALQARLRRAPHGQGPLRHLAAVHGRDEGLAARAGASTRSGTAPCASCCAASPTSSTDRPADSLGPATS